LTRAFGGDARAPRDVDSALRSALLAVLERDFEAAESLLDRAVRIDSTAVEPYLALARLFRMKGEVGRAIRIHQNLLLRRDLDRSDTVRALAGLAADFRQGGFLRRAIACYEEVLAHDPRHREATAQLVRLLAQAREFPRALEMERRLAKLERRDGSEAEAELLVEMAEAAQAEGRSEDARKAVKKALRRNRRSARAWTALGALEAERGRSKAALAAWSRVPALDRRAAARVYPHLEASYAALGRARDFEASLEGLLESQPDDAVARMALARTLAARGEVDAACAQLRQVLERAPDDLEARGALGRLLLAEGKHVDAGREYAELLDSLERRGLLEPREQLS
jgi:lipopolysaccharide biosynthesis regulator YciM